MPIEETGAKADITVEEQERQDAVQRRNNVAGLLAVCQALQTKFWEACSELEGELGGDPDTFSLSTMDLEELDADQLIEDWDETNAEEEEAE